jgi:hypothetical protein
MAYYTYWEGVPVAGGELYARPRRAVGAWPTNDGLVMTYVAWPVAEFPAFRADVEGNLLATLDLAGDLGERVRAGRRAERFRGSPDLPGWFRTPYGPGWALVGDAGLALDPITGQGSATPSATRSCWWTRSTPASPGAGGGARRLPAPARPGGAADV